MQHHATEPELRTTTQTRTAVTIRRATLADGTAIVEMGRRLLPAAHPGALPPADMALYLAQSFNLAQVQAELQNPAVHIFLAENGRQTAGMVKIQPGGPPGIYLGLRPVELSRLYLNEAWIGQGVGKRLTRQGLRVAARNGYDVCWLAVWPRNHRALKFYRRQGFTSAGQVTYSVGQSRITMHVLAYFLQQIK